MIPWFFLVIPRLYPRGSFTTAFLQVETHVLLTTSLWVPFFKIWSSCLGKALLPKAIPHSGRHLPRGFARPGLALLRPEQPQFRDFDSWRNLPDPSPHVDSWTWEMAGNTDRSKGQRRTRSGSLMATVPRALPPRRQPLGSPLLTRPVTARAVLLPA